MDKGQERDLRAFLKLFKEIDEVDCEFTDVPDLLVPYQGQRIGIEHTRVYNENPLLTPGKQRKPQELLHFQIVSSAHKLFKQKSSVPLWLGVTFTQPFDIRRNDVPAIAQALADAVFFAVSTGIDVVSKEQVTTIGPWYYQDTELPFPREVQIFNYRVQDNPDYECWGPTYGYGVPKLDVSRLDETIQSKNAKIPEYQKRCDDVWLLIVTDLGMPSSHFTIAEEIATHSFMTLFKRIFLLTDIGDVLMELNTHDNSE